MKKRRRFFGRGREASPEAPVIDPSAEYPISQFDTVRVVTTDEMVAHGYVGRTGVCYGFTTPSVTNVEVVGDSDTDFAFNVHFEEEGVEDAWFSPDLLVFVDHGAGTTITVGDKSFVRRADGEWDMSEGSEDATSGS